MKKEVIVLISLMIITVLVTLLYIRDYADIVSNLTNSNYFIVTVIVPLFIGFMIGSIGAFLISVRVKKKVMEYYSVPLDCALVSMIPMAWILLMMSSGPH